MSKQGLNKDGGISFSRKPKEKEKEPEKEIEEEVKEPRNVDINELAKAEKFMYLGMSLGDTDKVRETAIACIQSGIDPDPILDRVLGKMNQEYLFEISKDLETAEEFREAAQKLYDEVGRPTPNYKKLMEDAVLKENEKLLLDQAYQKFLQMEQKMIKHKKLYPELYTGFKTDEEGSISE